MLIRRCHKSGFTLVELSIVLVILGLLAGSILAGRALIRAASLNAVISEYTRYATAIQTFKLRFNAYPGDMPNAVTFWGARAGGTADGLDAACVAALTPSTGTLTCNGNGNGDIDLYPSGTTQEEFTVWQHLANAGLIAGKFTGVHGPLGSRDNVLDINAPRSKLDNLGWGIFGLGHYGDINNFELDYGTTFVFGHEAPGAEPFAVGLTPEDTYFLDNKIDDGLPAAGILIAADIQQCTTATTVPYQLQYDAVYVLSNQNKVCLFYIRNIMLQ